MSGLTSNPCACSSLIRALFFSQKAFGSSFRELKIGSCMYPGMSVLSKSQTVAMMSAIHGLLLYMWADFTLEKLPPKPAR